MNQVSYEKDFNYCFNCGSKVDLTKTSNNENYCCISFRTVQESGAVETEENNNGRRFLLNLLPMSQFASSINSGCFGIVERAGLNWCPFCGINLEQEIP
jgi:hypothetical protein